jgi:hypothetical protein
VKEGGGSVAGGAVDVAVADASMSVQKPETDQLLAGGGASLSEDEVWSIVDSDDAVVKAVSSWVKTQMLEFLGDDEASLREFVVAQVRSHLPGGKAGLVGELELVLEDDAPVFVDQLWDNLVAAATHTKHGQSVVLPFP